MGVKSVAAIAALAGIVLAATPAGAQDMFGLKLKGSLGEGGFTRYVPPINNPTLNETAMITTELRPIYAYHDIPDDFVTNGGHVNVIAAQARLAFTERFGFIATTDGYSWLDFNDVLPDTDGLNDVAFGLKYAFVYDPAGGTAVTGGLRYTAPAGNIDTAFLDLTGSSAGYLNPFVSALQDYGALQVQGSLGAQIALSGDNWSFIHTSLGANYEVLPGLYPMLEMNALIPVDGGDRIPSGPLSNLTGTDLFDIRAGDPETVLTLGGGVRYRVHENVLLGLGANVNVLQDENHVHGWRLLADAVFHF
jgi:hypothetical protein